tara:strand:+ start:55 stop:222 length:168 start_codon:yes stop_codon:yes gene_type:complete
MVGLKRKEPKDLTGLTRWTTLIGIDGTSITLEWFEEFDGPWPYGDTLTKTIDLRK